MKMRWVKLLLLAIIFLSFILRFFKLGEIPPSLTWDEVAWGYNAYALGIDGKDEFGRFLPYDYLESFGDFKPPMYAYLDIIPIKVFGLNEFATRFPSAFFGALTILLTYFLTKQIFYKSAHQEYYALFSSFLLAVSPWHINLSRAAFEANVATFFIVAGVTCFTRYLLYQRSWFLTCSFIFFCLSVYTFNTARIVSPLLLIALVFLSKKTFIRQKKDIIFASVVSFLLILPVIPFLLSPQANLRFREVNIFSDIGIIEKTNKQIENDKGVWWSRLIHNRRLTYSVEFLKHYFDNLAPNFLFIKGDGNPKFSTQEVGQLYLWETPFLLMGIFMLFKKKEDYWYILPLWMIIGIIPAASARETPHALRIETILPTFQIFTAYGVINALSLIIQYRKVAFAMLGIIITAHLFYYLYDYYRYYPFTYSGEWQYGYKESINFVKTVEKKYDKVYVTTVLGRPYIYYLFYMKIEPINFRKNAVIRRDSFGFVTVDRIGKYYFVPITTSSERGKRELFIDISRNEKDYADSIAVFRLLNGKKVLNAFIK